MEEVERKKGGNRSRERRKGRGGEMVKAGIVGREGRKWRKENRYSCIWLCV